MSAALHEGVERSPTVHPCAAGRLASHQTGTDFLHIDPKTQLERFKEREKDPIKNFKIGPDDWRNRKRWDEYLSAYQDMFDRTHRPDAPWVIVPANDKRQARLQILKRAISALDW